LRIRRFAIGRLFMGSADGFAPVIRAEGVDVFALGEVQGLDERLAEIGEGGRGFGFHLTLGDGGEEASQGGAEIAGGQIAAGKVVGDILAGFLASEGLGFLAGVERAEIRMTVAPGNAAVAAVDKHERTQRGTVLLTCDRKAVLFLCDRRAVFFTRDRRAILFLCDRRAVDGAIGGHGSLQREILDFGESLAEARRTTEQTKYTTAVSTLSRSF
jgi:hypothetical protein